MNFFEHQDKARKRTTQLIILFIFAVGSLITVSVFAVYFILVFITKIGGPAITGYQELPQLLLFRQFLYSPLCWGTALLVIFGVITGSYFKWKELKRGGRAVAETLGGKRIHPDTSNQAERKILNVVTEMAIASGTPVPAVYLIDDASVNAFAAGFSRHDTVIGVTKGCIALLNREELQGVIAHEFSHIHNGDMNLNMRLIAILHGILAIGIIGYHFSSNHNKKRSLGNTSIIGLLFIAIGYIGTVFGNLIKAAVSRQREFLADASAVQFTRNPLAVSGALKKIGGLKHGSILSNGAASQFSHMYFGQGVRSSANKFFATHPALATRIKRLEPQWNGSFENIPSGAGDTTTPDNDTPIPTLDEVHQQFSFVQQATEFVGTPQPHHQEAAQILLSAVPEHLQTLAHNSFSSRALIYAILLDRNTEIRKTQLNHLKTSAHPATYRELNIAIEAISALPRALYLTLVDLCLPALKELSQNQYNVFIKNINELVTADQKLSLFEWSLFRIIRNHYEAPNYEGKFLITELQQEISIIFSLIVYAGANTSPGAAFLAGIDSIGVDNIRLRLSDEKFSLKQIDTALQKLQALKPLQKPLLLKSLANIIAADGEVTIEEAELYRAIGDTLDCPIPPIVV